MNYESRLRDEFTERLFEAVLLLQNKEDCYRFFEDLCTVAEIKSMGQRLEVAKMLDQDRTYTDIAVETGASTATISRVKRCLFFGADGYRRILDRLQENQQK